MKRIVLVILSLFVFSISNAQVTLLTENFEVVDSMVSSGNPAWFQESTFQHSGTYSMRDSVTLSDSAYLTTIAFSTVGYNFVTLTFWQICKISFADLATLEVSDDNGASWNRVTIAQYQNVPTGSDTNNQFTSVSYGLGPTGWNPFDDLATPAQTWWKHEVFDISIFAANAPQVKVRFKIADLNNSGGDGNYGWMLDDINIEGAGNELVPPHIAWSPSAIPLQGNVPSLGPFIIKDTITDASGISSATLYYTVNGGTLQSINMTGPGPVWSGTLPVFVDGDTICYYVTGVDAWGISATIPNGGSICIYASSGIHFPYHEDFETNPALWTSNTVSGSAWEYGTPNYGITTGAHSGIYCWDIDLHNPYVDNTEAYLISPEFDFNIHPNTTLSFWRKDTLEPGWDGTRLEYTTDGGATWNVLGTVNDPKATNWYNDPILNSSGLPAWTNASNGWRQSTYKVGCLFNTGGLVQLRFVFTTDGSGVRDGISIDDFFIDVAPKKDVGVSSIVIPGASAAAGSSQTVKVVVTNFGDSTVTGFNVNYSINGTGPVTQLYPGTLLACQSDTVTFTTLYTVPIGTFGICSFTTLTGDAQSNNDSLCKSSQGVPLLTLPYTDDFETPPSLWWDSSRTGTSWQLGTPNFGATNTAHSPLNAWDINLNSAYGNNARAILTSPLFDFTTQINAKLSFWMNRNLAVNDGVVLEYSLNGGNTWNRLGEIGDTNAMGSLWYNIVNLNFTNQPGWGNNSNGWVKYQYILSGPFNNAGNNVQFRFVFLSTAGGFTDGVSIDDFSLLPAPPVDLGVTAIFDPPRLGESGTLASVGVTIRNYGSGAVTSSDMVYSVNGTAIATETWTGNLAPGSSTDFAFTTQFTIPTGQYDICAYNSLVTDGDHSNDTLCTSKHGIPVMPLPYNDNFDVPPFVWSDSSVIPATTPLTKWELGTPNFDLTNSAHTPPNAWDVNLNTQYYDNAICYLTSPFFDFQGVNNARLTFWHNFDTEVAFDGTRLEYSTDSGSTWQVLGTPGDPLATRWYNRATIFSSGLPAWAGPSVDSTTLVAGWIKSTYKLVPLNGVRKGMLRFVYTTDGLVSATYSGYSIDDLKIIPPSPFDASALIIVNPTGFAPSGVSTNVRVVISNEGNNPISNFDISYSINGVLAGTATYPGTLQPSVSDTINLPSFNFPTGNFDICAYTQLAGDGDHTNDTTCKSSFGIPTFGAPYFDDFEGANNFYSPSPSDWEFGVISSPVINAAYSPVTGWKTILNGTYTGPNNDDLYSPFLDFTGAYKPELRFWHWIETSNDILFDGGRIDISTDAGLTWSTLGKANDTAATAWYTDPNLNSGLKPAWAGSSGAWFQSVYRLHFLENWTGGLVQFRFNFRTDATGNDDGWAIDNFEIFSPFPNVAPVALTPVFNPFFPSGGTSMADSVKIKNKGSLAISSVDVKLVVDGNTLANDHINYSPPLAPGSSAWHTFSTIWQPGGGGYQICAITSNPNGGPDIYPGDDAYCVYGGIFDSVTVTNSTPYCNDFEPNNGHKGWIPLNAYDYSLFDSDWAWGTPNKPTLNSAHSGSKTWITKIDDSYDSRDSSGLFSPVFEVDTLGCYELSFYHNYKTETYQDGGTVEYSIDNGGSWHIIGFAYENNWFNSLFVTGLVGGPPTAGWSGTARVGWEKAAHNMKFANPGHVIFRFRFGSDLTTQDEGWTFDDVCFQRVGPCTIGIDELAGNEIRLVAYPNPATEMAMFSYSLPQPGKVRLTITDVLGRVKSVVVNETQIAGMHQAELNVNELADGMYYCTLEVGDRRVVSKFVVAK